MAIPVRVYQKPMWREDRDPVDPASQCVDLPGVREGVPIAELNAEELRLALVETFEAYLDIQAVAVSLSNALIPGGVDEGITMLDPADLELVKDEPHPRKI